MTDDKVVGYKVFGLGDPILENLVSTAIESASKEVKLPQAQVMGLIIAFLKTIPVSEREGTLCVITKITQALRAAGWTKLKPTN